MKIEQASNQQGNSGGPISTIGDQLPPLQLQMRSPLSGNPAAFQQDQPSSERSNGVFGSNQIMHTNHINSGQQTGMSFFGFRIPNPTMSPVSTQEGLILSIRARLRAELISMNDINLLKQFAEQKIMGLETQRLDLFQQLLGLKQECRSLADILPLKQQIEEMKIELEVNRRQQIEKQQREKEAADQSLLLRNHNEVMSIKAIQEIKSIKMNLNLVQQGEELGESMMMQPVSNTMEQVSKQILDQDQGERSTVNFFNVGNYSRQIYLDSLLERIYYDS